MKVREARGLAPGFNVRMKLRPIEPSGTRDCASGLALEQGACVAQGGADVALLRRCMGLGESGIDQPD